MSKPIYVLDAWKWNVPGVREPNIPGPETRLAAKS